jgi:hypothetical protein
MARFTKITIGWAGLWFLAFIAFPARPSPATQIFSLLLALGLAVLGFISLIRLATHWRRERWRVIVPIAICGIVVVVAAAIGAATRRVAFFRSLPIYESIVRQLESGEIPVSTELRRILLVEGGPAYPVLAQRDTNGVLAAEFLTGSGFPVKHSGYLYCSSGSILLGSVSDSRWPKRQQMKPLWFWVSD